MRESIGNTGPVCRLALFGVKGVKGELEGKGKGEVKRGKGER